MKHIKVKDLGQIVTGNTPPTTDESNYGNFMPFIKATDIQLGCRFTYITEQSYSEKSYNKYKANLIPKGSTCIVTIGSIGKKMTQAHTDLFVNQAINAILPNKQFDKDYVYYVTRYAVLPQLKIYDSGTTSGRENISKSSFSNIRLFIEENLSTQRKIASILSAYDNLIENNAKRIKLLEQMAENLYKEWFVRFRFPGHEHVEMVNGLPKGWKVERLSNIAVYSSAKISGSDIDLYISTENMLKESAGIDINMFIEIPEGNVTKVCINDILVSNIRPYFKKIWLADRECGCSNDVLSIRAKMGIDPIFLYYSLRKDAFFDHMVAGSNGTKMPRGNKNFTMKYQIILPDDTVMSMFSAITQKINKQRHVFELQSQLLTRQRDLLLPRLMNGKLEVKR